MANNKSKNILYGILFIFLLAAMFMVGRANIDKPEDIGYDTFAQLAKDEQINKAVLKDNEVLIELKDGSKKRVIMGPNDTVTGILKDHGVEQDQINRAKITPEESANVGTWVIVLLQIVPFVLIIVFIYFMMRQAQGASNQALSFGRSRARLFGPDKDRVLFKDVAGLEEAKQELVEVVDFLKNPGKFKQIGAKIPKGVLLIGSPGTGKTMLAKAVAGEAAVPFYSISGSEFVEMFVGVGAARVRDLFSRAKKNAPGIIFIDEIDAVGRQRGTGLGGSHDEREQTLNQILVEMDGFETDVNVIVMAATNRPDVLDPALLRPGRFDRRVTLDMPDLGVREAILKVHSVNKPLEKSVSLRKIAQQTAGFTGADLANLMNEGAILAARRNKKTIGMPELYEAVEKVLLGPERKSHLMDDDEKKVTAYHEGGHAVVGHVLPRTDPVHKVSIVSRGQAGGYTWSVPEKEKRLYSKADFEDMIAQMLGGRVAEALVFGDITTGAENDLANATRLARKMVMEFGMGESDRLKNQVFGHKEEMVFLGKELGEQRNFSEEIASSIDKEVNRIIDESYSKALNTLTKYRSKLELITQKLIEKETIEGPEFSKLMKDVVVKKHKKPKKQ